MYFYFIISVEQTSLFCSCPIAPLVDFIKQTKKITETNTAVSLRH